MKPNEVVKMSLWPVRASCYGAFGVGALGDVLKIGRLDLIAERLFHRLAADIVLITPAEIADRPDVDESDFQLVGGIGAAERCSGKSEDRGHNDDVPFLHDVTPGWQDELPFSSSTARSRTELSTVGFQRSGTNTRPSDAGAADPAVPRLREINTRTITVAR
jgi:hypothetical protein